MVAAVVAQRGQERVPVEAVLAADVAKAPRVTPSSMPFSPQT